MAQGKGWGGNKTGTGFSPGSIQLRAQVAQGGGIVPEGEDYYVGTCPLSGDVLAVYITDPDKAVLKLLRLCRFNPMQQISSVSLEPQSAGAGFGRKFAPNPDADELAPEFWRDPRGQWQFRVDGSVGVLSKGPAVVG